MAEMEIKRSLFGLNGRRLENFFFAKQEVFDQWKNGELLFFPTENCFASFDITEERDAKILELFDEEEENTEWRKTWSEMSEFQKKTWWYQFVRSQYVALTYEEFMKSEQYVKQDIKLTVHLPSGDVDAIVFFSPKLKGSMRIEV